MTPKDSDWPISVLDLFAGCGGLTEGFHQFRPSGAEGPVFQSVGAVEWDPAAAATYAMNFGAASRRTTTLTAPEIYSRDISGWEPKWNPGEIDVVVGGPPCQGFSGLNRHGVGGERNQLWEEFIRVVVAVRPRVFVIENVDRFVRSPEFANLKSRIGNGDLQNYRLVLPPFAKEDDSLAERSRRYLLNAADYGSPQARRRAIVIGVRTDGEFDPDQMQYPTRTHAKRKGASPAAPVDLVAAPGQRAWLTADGIFSSTAKMSLTGPALPERQCTVSFTEGEYSGQGGYLTTELHIARNPEELSLFRYAAIPKNGGRADLRGRYLCRFSNGDKVILEKQGLFRNEDGSLAVLGEYLKVENGVVVAERVRVTSCGIQGATDLDVARRSRSEVFSVDVHVGGNDLLGTLEYLSTSSWDAHNAGSGDVMGRVREGAPSVTIRTEFFKPEKGRYLHPTQDRPITHYEAAALQGFPENYKWCGSKTEIARQIGNAVPIPLGKKIAEAIYDYLRPGPPAA